MYWIADSIILLIYTYINTLSLNFHKLACTVSKENLLIGNNSELGEVGGQQLVVWSHVLLCAGKTNLVVTFKVLLMR